MARQGISVQRRALNADSGTCGSGPDGKGCVLNGNPCMSASGGDAGGDCGRAAGRAGLVGFPRPEDEAVGQVGSAVLSVTQCPARRNGICGAGPHQNDAAGNKFAHYRDKGSLEFLYHAQKLRKCHQRTSRRPVRLGTVSLSLSLSHGFTSLQAAPAGAAFQNQMMLHNGSYRQTTWPAHRWHA